MEIAHASCSGSCLRHRKCPAAILKVHFSGLIVSCRPQRKRTMGNAVTKNESVDWREREVLDVPTCVAAFETRDDASRAVDEFALDVDVAREHHLRADLENDLLADRTQSVERRRVGQVAVSRLEHVALAGETRQALAVEGGHVLLVSAQARRQHAVALDRVACGGCQSSIRFRRAPARDVTRYTLQVCEC